MTLEKIFFKFPPLLRVLEPGTFRLRVRRSNHWAIPAPATQASKKKKKKKRRKALRRLKKKKKKKEGEKERKRGSNKRQKEREIRCDRGIAIGQSNPKRANKILAPAY